ncbi:FAD-binding oxidoreductase [Maritimibacter sp. 55A14]|uniref:NAD(P)/FAD-dependent oxidoreductase n=1 Tax=Maritimibacter sp. 55A14 TaxID=2174844 RepID=UPI0018EE50A0|nr:FAD-binding oxidoreductase [Maritimibacter sp. 55A14]
MSLWAEGAAPGTPYWWEGAETPALTTDLPERADILVIGAGYTGLSAAIAAHDCGASVCVVDAEAPGRGASTRNGGMVGAHPRLGWDALAKSFGGEVADALFAEATPALDFVRDLIAREGIDCDFRQTGRVQLAWTRVHFEAQQRLAAHVRAKSDVKAEILDRAALAREIGTGRYFGGILFPEHGALHPRKYHDGLLAAVLRRGVPVLGGAEVTSLDRQGGGFTAQTAKGPIRAEKVILATNGYTTPLFRWHVARVFPLPSYLIATEPLPENLIGHLAPGRRMMVETRARHSYFRVSPDGTRILFGGRASMREVDMRTAARRLHATMTGIWPELAEVRVTHAWWGNTGFSFSHMPRVGEHAGLHYAMGFSGSGTVMAPWLGAKAAWRALGDPRGETAYAATALRRHVLHPFARPHFLKAADLWYRFAVDAAETRAGR